MSKPSNASFKDILVAGLPADVKTEWVFSDYTDEFDPKIEKEVKDIAKAYKSFAKKYADKAYLKNAKLLASALADYEALTAKATWKGMYYLVLRKTIDSGNLKLEAEINRLNDIAQEAVKHILFFGISISKLDTKKQKIYLKDEKLKKYRYLLKLWFDDGKHTLSEAEEKILTDKSTVAHDAWVSLQDRYENAQTVIHGDKTISLSEAMSIKSDLPRKERRALHKAVREKYKEIGFVAEAELNAVIRNKKIDDELRGYKTPYESTIRGYQNDVKSIENLVDVVTKANSLAHRFFKIKAKVINEIDGSSDTKITIAELGTGLARSKGSEQKIPLVKAIETISKTFAGADPVFAQMFESYLKKGQIDFFPKPGKQTGAFCMGNTGIETRILTNYAGKLNDVTTIAHEMGHAIHTDLSKEQPAIYEGYTISVAEVASTFFENIVLESLLQEATPEEKRDLLLTRMQDRISTIFAQVAYFQFEKKLHALVRQKGFVSKEEIAAMFADCRRVYTGDAVEVVEDDGYAFVYISHFRSFFYVYAYAYGQLIADALYAEYKKDKKFIEKVKTFLRAGGSMSPADIFKKIGIDTTKPDFFKKGLKKLEEDLKYLEQN